MVSCSIVVPVHNEAENLQVLIGQFLDDLGSSRQNVHEVLLMENGSTDNTLQVCKSLEQKWPGLVVAHKIPFPSYGEAVKQGIMSASGKVVCILECDAMDISFFVSSLVVFEENQADFVVGSKQHPESHDFRPLKRRILTNLFNRYLKIFFKFPGSDTHGLKVIRTDVAKTICGAAITGGEVFQTEIVLLAHRMGFKVLELPIHLSEVRDTKVSIRRRFPKVMSIIKELNKSLSRFPEKN
jgi:glycosyltransferase involved in cell wall biosynthesis